MNQLKKLTSDWKNWAFLGTLLAIGGWVYSRVYMVNPAILGDEYLYSLNARKAGPWDPSPAGDFSNYLFNLVYSSTNLCGDAFYTCGKLLNILFFLGFLAVVFVIGHSLLNFWVAYAFTVMVGLSPLSVYTSMFLPESMYFFGIALVFYLALRAARNFTWKNWLIVGLALGTTSLIKPHAWISSIALGIFLLVLGFSEKQYRFKPLALSLAGFVAGAVVGRVLIGFIVAGPKALAFFGSYVTPTTVGDLTRTASEGASTGSVVGTSPINGLVALFLPQLNVHLTTISALMGISLIALIIGVFDVAKTKKLSSVGATSLLVFIWLVSFVLSIVMFTGLITGGGDDHTTRVLERYYDFLFVFVPLTGLAVFAAKRDSQPPLWLRLPLALLILVFITPAFSGFFGTLTIQIADAPNLAGLVVNQEVFNAAAFVGITSLVVFAFFPKFSVYLFILVLPVTMIGTGWQIQDQYQGFRGKQSAQDVAGLYIRDNIAPEEREKMWVAANSRFEATNVAFWADARGLSYEIYAPESALDETLAPAGTQWIVLTGNLTYVGKYLEVTEGDGYKIYKVQ